MYQLPNSSEYEELSVVLGALMTSQILGLSYNITCKMIRAGQIPGTTMGNDLRTFATTRAALRKYFDALAFAEGEKTARHLLGNENKG